MIVGSGKNSYKWIENWVSSPNNGAAAGWAHHGVAVSESGDVISFHQDHPTVLIFDSTGTLKSSWETGLTEGHGITLVKDGDTEFLWIADNGRKRRVTNGYEYPDGSLGPVSGRVVKTTLNGRIVMELSLPNIAVYQKSDYMPTSVAVNEERIGGNGDIWVADGYGQNQVHRFNKTGEYLNSITGTEGTAGVFDTPHAIFIDTRKPQPELYVADRSNGRIQVYDLYGNFKRVFGSDFLTSPSEFVSHEDYLIVAELEARLMVLDINDNLVTSIGDNQSVCGVEGWPNVLNDDDQPIRTMLLEPGKFNSPHGMAVDVDGNLYVAEWLIGGRFTKLAKT